MIDLQFHKDGQRPASNEALSSSLLGSLALKLTSVVSFSFFCFFLFSLLNRYFEIKSLWEVAASGCLKLFAIFFLLGLLMYEYVHAAVC